jgi:hypothetical protein
MSKRKTGCNAASTAMPALSMSTGTGASSASLDSFDSGADTQIMDASTMSASSVEAAVAAVLIDGTFS